LGEFEFVRRGLGLETDAGLDVVGVPGGGHVFPYK
jgi:hypothetical protein